jgi:hypothetical protein
VNIWWQREGGDVITDKIDPLEPLVVDLRDFLVGLRSGVPADAIFLQWLQNWPQGNSPDQWERSFIAATEDMVQAMEQWMACLDSKAAQSATNALVPADPTGPIILSDLLASWEMKSIMPDYFGADTWLSVIQANGWSTQGPRTDITE